MKKLLLLMAVMALECPESNAQDCIASAYFKKNTAMEMQILDSDGKKINRIEYKVLEVNSSGNQMNADVQTTMFDKKDKEINSNKVTYKCNGSEFQMSMRNFVPAQQQAMKDMEFKADDSYLTFPKSMSVGGKLPDGNFHMEGFMNGMKIMTVNLNVTDRQVVGKEAVTTPAGSFNCVKITAKQRMKAVIGTEFDTTEWYDPSVGVVVKSELYRKGKLYSTSLLTKLN